MRKNKNKIITLAMAIIIALTALHTYYYYSQDHYVEANIDSVHSKELSKNINFNDVDSLMIVAHPDDETIWGANHLRQGKYLVVCITNGDNEIRSKEFNKVMKASNTKGIMLTYPDKTKGKRDHWQSCKEDISKDIKYLVNKKHWKVIATHNPDGEYGHKQHKMTSQFVSEAVKQAGLLDTLQYFGKYVKAKQIKDYTGKEELKNCLSKNDYDEKVKLTSIYSSQAKVMKNLGHMLFYENWVSYHTWYNY